MHRALFACGLALWAGVASAEEAARHPTEALPEPSPHRAALIESRLEPAEWTTATPPNWTGDIAPTERPEWVDQHLDGHERFLQPFVLSSVYPEVAVRLSSVFGYHRQADAADLDQNVFVSFYGLEFYAPIVTLRDNAAVSAGSFRVNAKVPFTIGEHHAVAFFAGADLPVEGTLTDKGGFNSMFGYAFGSRLIGAQVRLGVGIDRLVADVLSPIEPSVLGDIAGGVRLGDYVQVLVQADMRKVIGAASADIRVWPGLRFFPLGRESFTLGASALLWFAQDAGNWETRRTGGVIDVGYVFL
jgi:hypothetical protein